MAARVQGLVVGSWRLALAAEAIDLIREAESDLLFDHSLRVFVFGSLQGERHRSAAERFEVDGADAARDFLAAHGIAPESIRVVWDAIALHTTPGIPSHKEPEVALVTAGVELDVLGIDHDRFPEATIEEVLAALPRVDFEESIIEAFADGIAAKPQTAFGNVKADVLAEKLPGYRRPNFCELIRATPFAS